MKTTIIHIIAALLLAAGASVANAQHAELSTQCSALKTAKKGNAILAKELAAQMEEAEKSEDFERVAEIMQASAELAAVESGLLFASIICNKPAEKSAAKKSRRDSLDALNDEIAGDDALDALNDSIAGTAATERLASPNCHALIKAASKGQTEIVRDLLLKGANPYAENANGINAIKAADIGGHYETYYALQAANKFRAEVCK